MTILGVLHGLWGPMHESSENFFHYSRDGGLLSLSDHFDGALDWHSATTNNIKPVDHQISTSMLDLLIVQPHHIIQLSDHVGWGWEYVM